MGKNKRGNAQNAKNNHHILWDRVSWSKNFWSNKLRNHPAMIMKINAMKHQELHELVQPIPVPSELVCEETYKQIDMLWERGAINNKTSLAIRTSVLVFCIEYANDETANGLKKEYEIANHLNL